MKTYINTEEIRSLADNLQYCLRSIESATDSLSIGQISSKAYKKNNFYSDYKTLKNAFNNLYVKIYQAISVLEQTSSIYEQSDMCIESAQKTSSFTASLTNISVSTTEGLSTTELDTAEATTVSGINYESEDNKSQVNDGIGATEAYFSALGKITDETGFSDAATATEYVKSIEALCGAKTPEEAMEACFDLSNASIDIGKIAMDFLGKDNLNKFIKDKIIDLSKASEYSDNFGIISALFGVYKYLNGASDSSIEDVLINSGEAISPSMSIYEICCNKIFGKEQAKNIIKSTKGDCIAIGSMLSIGGTAIGEYIEKKRALGEGEHFTYDDLSDVYIMSGLSGLSAGIGGATFGLVDIDIEKSKNIFDTNIKNAQDYINSQDWNLGIKVAVGAVSSIGVTAVSIVETIGQTIVDTFDNIASLEKAIFGF